MYELFWSLRQREVRKDTELWLHPHPLSRDPSVVTRMDVHVLLGSSWIFNPFWEGLLGSPFSNNQPVCLYVPNYSAAVHQLYLWSCQLHKTCFGGLRMSILALSTLAECSLTLVLLTEKERCWLHCLCAGRAMVSAKGETQAPSWDFQSWIVLMASSSWG